MGKIAGYILAISLTALLAVAAVPNFREAQIRQQLARTQTELASIAAGLEAYQVDYGLYPPDGAAPWPPVSAGLSYWYLPYMLTTPTPYLTTIPHDPFKDQVGAPYWGYRYSCTRSTWGTEYGRLTNSSYFDSLMNYWGEYRINSAGPDGVYGPTGEWMTDVYPEFCTPYDPTNGLDTVGDIERGQRVEQYLR